MWLWPLLVLSKTTLPLSMCDRCHPTLPNEPYFAGTRQIEPSGCSMSMSTVHFTQLARLLEI